jgi:2,3,4,5-tetrahydropyridine-2-carboxylate N-succinyltransferase
MSPDQLAQIIDEAFERRNDLNPATRGPVRDAVDSALDLLDRGTVRVAEKNGDGKWLVNQWLKKAVLLSFRLADMGIMPFGVQDGAYAWGWDKVPLKYDRWQP